METICEVAGVTSGAFYHHFADKTACFEAVYMAVERDFFDYIDASWKRKTDQWARTVAGIEAFFDACVSQEVRQIVLIDGPAVLGWESWHEIEGRYHFSTMLDGLKALMKLGYIERRPPLPLAHLLFGALNEAGRVLAHADDAKRVRQDLIDAQLRLMEGLRPRRGRVKGRST